MTDQHLHELGRLAEDLRKQQLTCLRLARAEVIPGMKRAYRDHAKPYRRQREALQAAIEELVTTAVAARLLERAANSCTPTLGISPIRAAIEELDTPPDPV